MLTVALNQPDWNTVGIAVSLFMALVFLPRFFKASAAKAREEQAQKTIEAYKERVEALEPQVERLQLEVRDCRAQAAKWEARYQEQAKYTAQAALHSVLEELEQTRGVFEVSMRALADLMTEHSRLVARALDRLDE
jgi:predicted  nucleic acid-binding Zn-ribbon protein